MVDAIGDIKGNRSWGVGATILYSTDDTFITGSSRSELYTAVSTKLSSIPADGSSIWVQAMAKWSAVANVDFMPTSQASAHLGVLHAEIADGGGYAEWRTTGNIVHTAVAFTEPNKEVMVAIHELGHVLGLDHPGHIDTGYFGSYNNDTTVMSYRYGVHGTEFNVATPMLYDIAAAQEVYGANTSYNSGDNVYELSGNTASPASTSVETVWDAGGIDTMTVNASVTTGAVLDLRGGVDENGKPYWSHLDNEYVAIAFDRNSTTGYVKIEKAIGGAGNDTIYGSKGNDTLDGGDGLNTIYGGAGDDRIFMNGTGGFVDGGIGNDTIVLDRDAILDVEEDTNWSIADADGKFSIQFDNYNSSHIVNPPYVVVQDGVPEPEGGYVYTPTMSSPYEINSASYSIVARFVTVPVPDTGPYRLDFTIGQNLQKIQGPMDMQEDLGIKLVQGYYYDGSENVTGSPYTISFSGFSSGLDSLTLEELLNSGRLHIDMVNNVYKFDFSDYALGDDPGEHKGSPLQYGGGGSSSISGNSGITDTLSISNNSTNVSVTNFSYTEGDRLEITAFDAGLTNLAAMSITNVSGNAQLTLPSVAGQPAVTVTITSVAASAINASYFLSNMLDYGTGSTLTGSDSTTVPDTISGTSGNDTIYANSGNDSASGGTGNDVAYGWYGNDTLRGGYGADSLYGDQDNDQLYGESGNDHLFGYTGLDTIYGGDGTDYIEGEDGADQLRGDSGNDTLKGGLGNDYLIGGAGTDSLYGNNSSSTNDSDNGADKFRYFSRNESTSTAQDKIWYLNPGDGDRIDLTGLGFTDLRQGYGHGNILGWDFDGTPYKNITLFSDSFSIAVNYENSIASTGVSLTDFVGVGPGFTVTHLGTDSADPSLTGGTGNDAIQGRLGNDVLDGGNGNDTLDGGAGADTLKGRSGLDVYFYDELSDSRYGGNYTDRDFILNWDSDDKIDVHLLGFTGIHYDSSPSTGVGTDPNGSELAYTRSGGDTLIYNSGDFEIKIDGEPTLTAGNFIFATGPGFEDENITGTSAADTITGEEGNDSINGGAGTDSITGGDGLDTLVGGAGNDTLIGGLSDDQLDGGIDGDHLYGGDGMDLLIGASGIDNMWGGTGADTFAFYTPSHSYTDIIQDFVSGIDKIDISDLGYSASSFVADSTPTGSQLGYYTVGSDLILEGHLNGDGFRLNLHNTSSISSSDIIFV